MTQENEDAIVGRIVRERREAQSRLDNLTTEAQRLGSLYQQFGELLRTHPEWVVFENQPVETTYRIPSVPTFKPAQFDAQKLITLTNEIRETMTNITKLMAEAVRRGI